MKVCVVGAGAIGGQLAVRLARAGAEVSLVLRNPDQRAVVAAHGLTLLPAEGGRLVATGLRAYPDCAGAGVQDLVVLALKAHQIRAVVPAIRSLFGPDAALLIVQNGIPWWYFQRVGGRFNGRRVAAVDPDGALAAAIEPARIIGSVAYFAGEVVAPGIIIHTGGDGLPIGELDGAGSARAERVAALLAKAGLRAPVLDDIRAELWFKLWSNAAFNAIGALTHVTMGAIYRHAATRPLVLAMMAEIGSIAARLGVRLRATAEERLAMAEKVARHKPSMAQDVEAGRALEIEALLGAVVELGRLIGTPVPHCEAVYACAKLLDKVMATGRTAFVPASTATR